MSDFVPMTEAPKAGDPWYNSVLDGGYNTCIRGNPKRRVKGLSSLPNCTGFATGRFNQIGNFRRANGECRYLGDAMAYWYINLAKGQKLNITQKPTLGGVMVWSGGIGNYGHVEVVEDIISDNRRILTSASEYYGQAFRNFERPKGDGNWRGGCSWMDSSYVYRGCISNPAIGDDMNLIETTKLIEKLAPALFEKYMAEREAAVKALPPDEYAKAALEWMKENKLMVGDGNGNQMPQAGIKREDVAVIIKALNDLLKSEPSE